MHKGFAFLIAVGLMMPHAAHALGERPWMLLNGVGGTYGMSDLNSEIDAFNAANAGTGLSFPHVDGGTSLGGAIGFETRGRWNIGLGIDRLQASTKAADASGSLEYRLGANAWRVFTEYALQPIGSSGIFVGGSLGFVQEKGHVIVSDPGYEPLKLGTSGNAPLFEGYAGGNWWLTPQFAVTGTAGYRLARLKEFKLEGTTFLMSNGEAMSLDFSGPTFRVGIKVASRSVSE